MESADREPDELVRQLEEQAGMIQAKVITGIREGEESVRLPARFAHAVASAQVAAARALRQTRKSRGGARQ